jgi:RNA polymerase sigma-32 factor
MEMIMNRTSPRASPKQVAPLKNAARFLTREEEQSLGRRYRQGRDPRVARTLVESQLRLVAKIAHKCCPRKDMLADVVQEGCLGLVRAVERYDPERNIRLSTYAAWWIRAYIYQYIMANSRMMKVATTCAQRKLFFNLNRESQRLERDGKEARSKDIANRLGVSEAAVVEMRHRLGGREVPFENTPAIDSGSQRERVDGTPIPPRQDQMLEDHQLRAAVARKLDQLETELDVRERTILRARLIAEVPISLRELGVRFGVGRERARQLEGRLKQRLRQIFQEFAEPFPEIHRSGTRGCERKLVEVPVANTILCFAHGIQGGT